MTTLISVDNFIWLILFAVYEILYKIVVIDKIKWRVQRKISKEQAEIAESVKSFYLEKLEDYKLINNERLERLRAVHTNETETLKHNLNTLLSLQLQHKGEERQALINFLSNCNHWVFILSKIKFLDYNVLNIKELKAKIESIEDEYFLNIHTERIKILLFITNEQITLSTYRLIEEIDQYKIDMENMLSELLNLLTEQYDSRYDYEDVFEDIGAAIVTAYSINNSDRINQLFLDFENFNGTSFKRCLKQIETFASHAKSYLTSGDFNQ